jgi:glycosyltransferase involved in cell wall biosynthesis
MMGYVDDMELLALYRRAILVVLPSLDEGFGVPALEAMSLGVPLVAARRGALPEVVGDAGLLVDPLDTGAITAALQSVLMDSSLRKRLVTAGLVRVPLFTWRNSAKSLIEAYQRAIERTKTGEQH